MTESSSTNNVYDAINDMLSGTKWSLMTPGSPKKIKMPETHYDCVGDIMNYYRSAGWIVRVSIMIEAGKRTYTLEFINPHHT